MNTTANTSQGRGNNSPSGRFVGVPEQAMELTPRIANALHVFLRQEYIPNPDGGPDLPWCSEIRIIGVRNVNRKTGREYKPYTMSAWFDTGGIGDRAEELAVHWCDGPGEIRAEDGHYAGGIYWCINPVTPGLLACHGSELQKCETSTSDEHIGSRYWLPIDIDPARIDGVTGASLKKVSSTDAEKAGAYRLAEQVRDYLCGDCGWPDPVQVY